MALESGVITKWDPMTVIHLPVGTEALYAGDLCSFESSAVVLFNAVGNNTTFCGVTFAKKDSDVATGTYIPLATKCILSVPLTSAAYFLGQGLKYDGTTRNQLVDHGASAADTIAWYHDEPATTTRANVLIDIVQLVMVAGIYETPVV